MPQQPDLPEEFQDDADEKLRLEIDIMKLKIQAELGGSFYDAPDKDVPPEIELQFLEQVYEFHEQHDKNPPMTIRTYFGDPRFKPSDELSEEELKDSWERLNRLYDEKGLGVDFLAAYPLAVRYDFMAFELLDHEVAPMPGWRFIYEEFHPNHEYDQKQLTERFMKEFFEGEFSEFCVSHRHLINDRFEQISLEAAQQLLQRFHCLFEEVKDWSFSVEHTSAQRDEEIADESSRLGFTEGVVKYTVIYHDGTEEEITGPFKLYMECRYACWEVVHFRLHGFPW